MYYTTPSIACPDHNAGWLDGQRRSYFPQDLYTTEKHLLYKCLQTLLYAEQKRLGMLNPYAEEFVPTEKISGYDDIGVGVGDKTNSTTRNTNSLSQRKTHVVREKDQDQNTTIDIIKNNKSKIKPNTFGWKVSKYGLKKVGRKVLTTQTAKTTKPIQSITTNQNRFQILADTLDEDLSNDNTVIRGLTLDIKNEELQKECIEAKKNMKIMRERYDVEAMSGHVLERLLMEYKGTYDDYKTKCSEVEESKRTIHELQNDKRTALAAKEATEAALYGYQEAMEENDTLRNKNNELLRKVSILESKMEERNDWKARYEDEERKSKELNLNLERSNELLDLMSHRLGKEVAEMKKLARQDMVKVPKTKKAQRRSR